jgi:hypothetical protein
MALAKLSGTLNILFQLGVTIGIFVANLVNYGTNKTPVKEWRFALAGAGSAPAPMLGVSSIFLLDTPNSLLVLTSWSQRGGKSVLQKVCGVDDVEEESEDIRAASEMAVQMKHPCRNLV